MEFPNKGDIVRILVNPLPEESYIVIRLTEIYPHPLLRKRGLTLFEGDFIAGDIYPGTDPIHIYIHHSFEILTIKELPLCLGYEHTGDLLVELLKGE